MLVEHADFTFPYTEPGAYDWTVDLSTGPSYPEFVRTHGPCTPLDPYVSGAHSTGTIVVASPEPPASTTVPPVIAVP